MFRSTLVVYTKIGELDEKRRKLKQLLAKHRMQCLIQTRKVKEPPGERQRRPKGSMPVGQEFLSIDICRVHRSEAHLAHLAKRLPIILEACSSLNLLNDETCLLKILDITATNGSDDSAFVRRIWFNSSLLSELSRHGVSIRIDIPPVW